MNVQDLARRARAHGLDVIDETSIEHAVCLGPSIARGGTAEAILTMLDDDTDRVEVMLVYPTWSYENGPDAEEYVVGDYPLGEALSMLVWFAQVEERRNDEVVRATEEMDRAQAEYEAREQREADEHEERVLAEAARREAELEAEV